jgi:GTP-binding protein YchF
MRIGIIGPPQSGKTTMFKVLLQQEISGSIGSVRIPDSRIEKISEIFSSKKTTHPELTFLDIGPVSTLNKKDLSDLHDIDLFICVIGSFFSEDPGKDFESSLTDMMLLDLELMQNRIARLKKEGKKGGIESEMKILEKCQAFISDGKPLRNAGLTEEEIKALSGMLFLSLKPVITVLNLSDGDKDALNAKTAPIEEYCRSKGIPIIRFFGKTELELMELEEEERKKFIKEMGPGYSFREDVSRLIIKQQNLITFFTTGEKETRGWYLKSGLPILEAAGKIHSDMKRGFIRAEVVNFEDFIKYGSMHQVREKGLLKVEGKEYIVREGDIVNIRFNV